MNSLLANLVSKYSKPEVLASEVIPWSCPVPVFGQLGTSYVATLGLNPSNLEFVDRFGNELHGAHRRFETLTSLRLSKWSDAGEMHFQKMWDSLQKYFLNNPYDRWFRKLDLLISETSASYYLGTACHLDLIPYATSRKWSTLTSLQRDNLLLASGNCLALLLGSSNIKTLILNGASVISHFQALAGISFRKEKMEDWTLRSCGELKISGYSVASKISSLSGMPLSQPIAVIGFNHNIQSSFGVTNEVTTMIRRWIGQMTKGHYD